jgi:hypothetical protein
MNSLAIILEKAPAVENISQWWLRYFRKKKAASTAAVQA